MAGFQKEKIAILPFELKGEQLKVEDLGEVVSEWLITAFVQNGRFDVVERKLLRQVIEEHQMVDAGLVRKDSSAEIGKMVGAGAIISGSVMKYSGVVDVNARIIDVENGSIVTAENIRCKDQSQLHELVVGMADQLIKNFPLTGLIVKRNNDSVIIALGKDAGSAPGMLFMSYREGEVIKHPKTQEVLFVDQVETGKVTITEVEEKISKGLIIEESSTNPIGKGNYVKSLPQVQGKIVKNPAVEKSSSNTTRNGYNINSSTHMKAGGSNGEREFADLIDKAESAMGKNQFDDAGIYLDKAMELDRNKEITTNLREKYTNVCVDLGFMFEMGNGVSRDQRRAGVLYRKACDGENAEGCSKLGNMYYNGTGVIKNLYRAADLFRKACDGGVAIGCSNLGTMYNNGQGVAKNFNRAADLFKRACDGGIAHGCATLGYMYHTGQGVNRDDRRAIEYTKLGCDGGNAAACENLKR